MDDPQFKMLELHLGSIVKSQEKQSHDIGKIFKEQKDQGERLVKVETKLDSLNDLKEDVEENAKRLNVIRGIGIAVSAIFGSILGWIGLK